MPKISHLTFFKVAAGGLLGAAKGHRWALWGAGGAGGEVLQPLRALGVLGVLGGNWGALLAARAAGKLGPRVSNNVRLGAHWCDFQRLVALFVCFSIV